MNHQQVVSTGEWQDAREKLLVEKKATPARAALAAERRRLPKVGIEKEYVFEGPDGKASLLDLFGGRQLIVYRFLYGPGVACWPEAGCGGRSVLHDEYDA